MTPAVGSTPRLAHLSALLGYCALTLTMVWPLVSAGGERVPGWEGDNLYYIRQFWWVAHALFDLRASPFFDPESYHPLGYSVARGELVPAATFLGAPITRLAGPVVAYNATLSFTFVAAGFGTYLWVSRLTGSRSAGFLAGVVAAFLPYRFAHLPGHLPLVSMHWLPWALYAFERFAEHRRLACALALGSCLALVALSSWYYAYTLAILFPVYALMRARPWREQRLSAWWPGLCCAAAVAMLIVVPFLGPYLELREGGELWRDIEELEVWSLNVYDFFLPNRLHRLWGDAVARGFPQVGADWVERGVSLGYTALGLGLVACFARRRDVSRSAVVAVWVVSYAIALGPTLHVGDQQVRLPLPPSGVRLAEDVLSPFPSLGSLREEIAVSQATPIPLPSIGLFVFVPLTSGMRVMARFGVWTGLATAALAGMGFVTLLGSLRRRIGPRRLVESLLLGAAISLVLLESWSEVETMALRPREVDRWLATQPAGAVVELPIAQAVRPLQDYYKTVHEQPTIFGPVGDSFPSPELEVRKRALRGFPSAAGVEALRDWDARYVLFTEAEIPGWQRVKQALARTPGLRFERTLGGVHVYAVEPEGASDSQADPRDRNMFRFSVGCASRC